MGMDMDHLRKRLDRSFNVKETTSLYESIREEGTILEFSTLLFDKVERIARNAAWTLALTPTKELSCLVPIKKPLMDLVMETSCTGLRRTVMSILERMDWNEPEPDCRFLDFCLEHMTDCEEPPASQSLCMKLAFYQTATYPELRAEMLTILENMEMEYYPPATKSVRNRILGGKFRR